MQALGPEMLAPLLCSHYSGEGLENLEAISAAEGGFTGALGVRHHAENIAARAADSGNVVERSIGTGSGRDFARRGRITENDALIALQLGERGVVAEVVAVH